MPLGHLPGFQLTVAFLPVEEPDIEVMEIPVLLIHFNRPEVTRRQLEALSGIAPRRVFVLCDGARPDREGESERVDAVRDQFERLPWEAEIHRIYRERNLGVSANISSGITDFFEAVEAGIILEDDCLPSVSFFPFVEELLEKYRSDSRVLMLSGHSGFPPQLCAKASYTFSNYYACWGWATWRRAWKRYDHEMSGFRDRESWRGIARRVFPGLRQRLYWERMFRRVFDGRSDSWAYRLQLSQWQSEGLSIFPSNNLVENIGFGLDATNTSGLEERMVRAQNLDFPLVHPDRVANDPEVDRWIEDHWHSKSFPERLKWVVRKVREQVAAS